MLYIDLYGRPNRSYTMLTLVLIIFLLYIYNVPGSLP